MRSEKSFAIREEVSIRKKDLESFPIQPSLATENNHSPEMIFFYRIAFPLFAVLLCPYYLRRMWRRGGYGRQLFHRLGIWPNLSKKPPNTKRIWIQAVSVGELSSIQKLVNSLSEDSRIELVISSTTSTGLNFADCNFSSQVLALGPFPLDWWPCSVLAWSRIQPDLIITIDSELWPEHFHQAQIRGVPVVILNARLSDRTYSRLSQSYLGRAFLLPKGLEILTTSERQRSRWLDLGIDPQHIQICGNLKVDSASYQSVCPERKLALRQEFGFSEDSVVLAGISTWPGEEELLIETILELGKKGKDARLLIIPRHSERRKQIIKMLHHTALPYHVRTDKKQAPQGTIVYLADTTGELAELIHGADLGWIGKTLAPNRGGQNPIEPISIGLPLITGSNYQNFRETCGDLLLHDAILEASTAEEAKIFLTDLATNSEKCKLLGSRAHAWRKKQGSPTRHSLNRIFQILEIPQG